MAFELSDVEICVQDLSKTHASIDDLSEYIESPNWAEAAKQYTEEVPLQDQQSLPRAFDTGDDHNRSGNISRLKEDGSHAQEIDHYHQQGSEERNIHDAGQHATAVRIDQAYSNEPTLEQIGLVDDKVCLSNTAK